MSTAVPNRLGDFEIIRELGRGGMGVVYEARQVSLNRKVALKVLSGSLGLTGKAIHRFQREAEAAAKLHHTNIVPIYTTGEADGAHFYAMELIDGPSLDHAIREMVERLEGNERKDAANHSDEGSAQTATFATEAQLATTGPYPDSANKSADAASLTSSSLDSGSQYFDTVARMIADVADALEHAHQNGVVHRDIKPSNLLLSSAGRLSVNDFGLARMLEQAGMTMTGEFVGTPAYMSPEQITAGRAPLNHRTDIYSLGATLYELLTLRRPFRGERRDETIAQIMHKEPIAPRKVNAKAPVDLETICLKCLEKDPDRRYQTAGELADDLRRYVNRFAISAKRAGPIQRLAKWVKRHPAVAASLSCLVVAVGIAAFFAFQSHRAEERLAIEKQERALEAAMAAAIGGDLEQARAAIREAEKQGVPLPKLALLRGQLAFYSSDAEGAITELEHAVTLAPNSAAARGMLAIAYAYIGDAKRHDETMMELEEITPRTTEDFLFKGYAEIWNNPAKGLETMKEAVKRSHSLLARSMRAEARIFVAADRGDLKEAEGARADAQAAKDSLADNPYVLMQSNGAHMNAASLYEVAGDTEKADSAWKEADIDAQILKRWEATPGVALALWIFYDQRGKKEAFDVARRAAEKSKAPHAAYHYGLELYRRGEPGDLEQAKKVLEGRERNSPWGDILHACILGDLYPALST